MKSYIFVLFPRYCSWRKDQTICLFWFESLPSLGNCDTSRQTLLNLSSPGMFLLHVRDIWKLQTWRPGPEREEYEERMPGARVGWNTRQDELSLGTCRSQCAEWEMNCVVRGMRWCRWQRYVTGALYHGISFLCSPASWFPLRTFPNQRKTRRNTQLRSTFPAYAGWPPHSPGHNTELHHLH